MIAWLTFVGHLLLGLVFGFLVIGFLLRLPRKLLRLLGLGFPIVPSLSVPSLFVPIGFLGIGFLGVGFLGFLRARAPGTGFLRAVGAREGGDDVGSEGAVTVRRSADAKRVSAGNLECKKQRLNRLTCGRSSRAAGLRTPF